MAQGKKDPFRTLSRRVRASLENSPEVEAFISGDRILPLTWGGYATRALDMELCEPTVDAVVTLLGGDRWVNLGSSELVFAGTDGEDLFDDFRFEYIDGREKLYLDDLRVEVNRLSAVIDTIVSNWKIDPELGQTRANEVQKTLDADDPESELTELEFASLCNKRDALSGGIEVNFEEFAKALLGCNVLDEESPSELAPGWIRGVKLALSRALRQYARRLPLSELYARDFLVIFPMILEVKNSIERYAYSLAQQRAEEDWEKIEPVFMIKGAHRTLAGTEI